MLERLTEPPRPLRDTFGTDSTSTDAYRAMLDLAGGPAALREDQ